MGFNLKRYLHEPILWSIFSILLSIAACILYAYGHNWSGILAIMLAVWCGGTGLREIRRLRHNINYLISAAINGDFSYKFPVTDVADNERRINMSLNLIVAHLESLGMRARQEAAFLETIINLVDAGIIVANGKGHVINANNAARRLLSLPVITDIRQIPADCHGLEIKKTAARLRDEEIDIFTISDVSRMMQTAEIESLEKLTRVLTHEIMNSLTPVNSISETLCRHLEEGRDIAAESDLHQQIEAIRSSSRSLMDFVKNFRKFTVIPEPKPQVIYLKTFLQRQISLARSFDKTGNIDFSLLVFPPDTMAYTDANLLGQVILNILKNAIEANPGKVETEVSIKDDESVEISISNDGAPIPENILPQIFTPFFTTKQEGSGIGLSLSRRIVASLGGTLLLTPQPYTRFSITLP